MNIRPPPPGFVAHCGHMGAAEPKIQGAPGLRVRPWLACFAAALATAALLVLAFGDRAALSSFGYALLSATPKTALWLMSAAGLGRALASAVPVRGTASEVAIGSAVLLAVTQWAGTSGLLGLEPVGPFLLLAPGWWMLGRHLLAPSLRADPAWSALATGVATGAMLAASMVPAGFLWSTEFGGYDALSYHLQVPREWAQAGAFRPLAHAAYSGLPNFVEGAFAHLMTLCADPRDAALSCQLLHASLAAIAAWSVGDAIGGRGGAIATLALLATPWVTVTGSLAYSESGVLLGMALALHAARMDGAWRSGVVFGLAAATMVGSKASSVALAVPAALALQLARASALRDPRWWIAWIAVAFVALFPWLLRNTVATTAPVFPLLASKLGAGWWSAEQAARWDRAHASEAGPLERVVALWRQFPAFGVGPNPLPGEPWRWLWGPLPWLGTAALAGAWTDATRGREVRALAIACALVVAGWLSSTHLQSRFLIPVAVPLAAAIGLAWDRVDRSHARRVAVLACVAWSLVPAWTLAQDSPKALRVAGRVDLASGDLDIEQLRSPDDREVDVVRTSPMVEAALGTLFEGERVLAVGWSTPFWLPPGTNLRWSTVWDTNPAEIALAQPDPLAWLRERFELVLLDEGMLRRWEASGWLSPGLDRTRLLEVLRECPQMDLLGGRRLVGLRGALRPHWPVRRPPATDAPY